MSDLHRAAPKGFDRAKLDAIVEPIARAHGAEVVDIEFKPDQGGWVLRLFVEKLGSADHKLSTQAAAVDLELCSNVARDLSPALDVADLIPHGYHLEVSSPGVERPLRGEADFVRFAGQKAKIKLHGGVPASGAAPQKILVGILGPVEAGCLSLTDGSTTHTIPLSDVASSRLVFEFGPAPKPGKPAKGQGKAKVSTERSKRSV